MKIVGYIRVSTDRQAERGLGLDVQERSVRSWARANGHRVVAVYRDEGVSGMLAERDGLADALDAVRTGRAGAVVVPRLDRLARDLVVQETLLAEVWRLGGEVFSTAGGEGDLRDDPDDPSRKLVRQVLGAIAEYERDMIALRLRAGRKRKAERGGYAHGSPPYGWRGSGGRLVKVPAEQKALARMLSLRDEGCSTRQVAATLAAEGWPTKRGGAWSSPVVARILSRHPIPAEVA
jgi:DNA invertase Pin-like site-specific DNA recombinase